MKVCICAIAKEENVYLREWVEWHKNIGISKIFLYDNNDEDGERFEDVINDYVESGFVQIISCLRGINYGNRQMFAYNDFYKSEESLEYDWVAFIDIDEYINTNGIHINTVLSKDLYKNFDVIKLYWKYFGDNNIVRVNNTYSVRERFETAKSEVKKISKSIVRLNKNIGLILVHNPYDEVPTCDEHGRKVPHICGEMLPGVKPTADIIWIDHFRYKTIEEFVKKMTRGVPRIGVSEYLTLDDFFKFNEKTPEKIEYLKSIGIEYE